MNKLELNKLREELLEVFYKVDEILDELDQRLGYDDLKEATK